MTFIINIKYKINMFNKNLENLLIISNTKNYKIPYGDYLRILAFAPNLGFDNIYHLCDQKLSLLSKEHIFIKTLSYRNKKKIRKLLKNSFIIDLEKKGKNTNNIFYFQSVINKKKTYKKNMVDILSSLSKYFGIKNYKLFTTKLKPVKFKQEIFISWKAPKDWKIKEYPLKKFKDLSNKFKKDLNIKIKFQRKNESMKTYIKNIKESKIIISIVNLGCHIANLYDKKLIMLSGPNYHEDSKLNKSQITIFPKKFCRLHFNSFKNIKYKNRVANLKKDTNECYCMKNIDEKEIFYKTNLLLNE